MIYLSAGHHLGDSGAVSNSYKESQLCIELRDLVKIELDKAGYAYISDKDYETLSAYLNRIQPGSGSVLCEIHFNAAGSASATGVEVIYPEKEYHKTNHHSESTQLAKELSKEIAEALKLANRGAKKESQTARKSLAVLKSKAGISVLPEICFISNPGDMEAYQRNKGKVAKIIASYLIHYEQLKS
jgi:N-acetylmuramoyl-L-alanine amidase